MLLEKRWPRSHLLQRKKPPAIRKQRPLFGESLMNNASSAKKTNFNRMVKLQQNTFFSIFSRFVQKLVRGSRRQKTSLFCRSFLNFNSKACMRLGCACERVHLRQGRFRYCGACGCQCRRLCHAAAATHSSLSSRSGASRCVPACLVRALTSAG